MKIKVMTAMGVGAIALALGGCATQGNTTFTPEQQAAARVDQEMLQTTSSIDNSLHTLIVLERGDAGPRKADPIGSTVAGAAGPDQAPVRVPRSPTGNGASSRALLVANANQLDQHVRIHWSDGATGLLQKLADASGYDFQVVGDGKDPRVVLKADDESIKEVLSQVADQVDAKADVRVSTANRRIQLVFKQ